LAGPYEIFGSLYRRAQPNIAYGRVDCPTFNALQMSRKVTPNDFKSLPSKEEQIIIITNHPHYSKWRRPVGSKARRRRYHRQERGEGRLASSAPQMGVRPPIVGLLFGVQARGH